MTPEGKVKAALRAALERRGLWRIGGPQPAILNGWFYMPQNMGLGANGIPDFMGCIGPGARLFGIEAKRPGGKPTTLQLDRIFEIGAAGGIAFVASSVDDLTPLWDYLEASKLVRQP